MSDTNPESTQDQPTTEDGDAVVDAAPVAEDTQPEAAAAADVEDSGDAGQADVAPVEASPDEAAAAVNGAVAVEDVIDEDQTEEVAVDSGAAAAADDESAEEAPGVPGVDWYIIHTYSGFENKVKESLRTRSEAFGFEGRIGEILIPTEDVVEMRNGKKVTSKRLLYPGYVLVQISLDDELWHVVKNTPRVTGFVGGGHDPQPLTATEVNQILHRQTTSAEKPRPKMEFARNDRVKIVDGPFASFTGTVEEVNEDRSTVKVMVTIFGRGTPVELEYFQVEKES